MSEIDQFCKILGINKEELGEKGIELIEKYLTTEDGKNLIVSYSRAKSFISHVLPTTKRTIETITPTDLAEGVSGPVRGLDGTVTTPEEYYNDENR